MIEVVLPTWYFQDWKRILIREPFWVNLKLSNSVTTVVNFEVNVQFCQDR